MRQSQRPPWLPRDSFWVLGSLAVVYAILLHYAYREFISPAFSYLGQTYRSPARVSELVSIVMVGILVLSMPRRSDKPSEFVLWVMLLVAIAPSILIAQYADILSPNRAMWLATLVLGIFLSLITFTRHGIPQFHFQLKMPAFFFHAGLAIVTVLVNGLLLLQSSGDIHFTTFDAVGEVRQSYKGLVAGIPLTGYLVQLQMAVINPVLIAVGVTSRRPVIFITGVVGQILIYGITGYKLSILSPVFITVLALYLRRRTKVSALSLVVGITGAMTAALILDAILGGRFFVTIFINRLMAAPGVLTSAHVWVFDDYPRYYWSHSFLSGVFDPPSQLNPAYFVGRVYNGADTQSNVNFVGDGYANAGVLGVLIEAAVLIVIFTVLDAASRGIPIAITIPSTMVAALGLANNSAFTSVLTGGFAGLIVVFALWPRENRPPKVVQRGLVTAESSSRDEPLATLKSTAPHNLGRIPRRVQ